MKVKVPDKAFKTWGDVLLPLGGWIVLVYMIGNLYDRARGTPLRYFY